MNAIDYRALANAVTDAIEHLPELVKSGDDVRLHRLSVVQGEEGGLYVLDTELERGNSNDPALLIHFSAGSLQSIGHYFHVLSRIVDEVHDDISSRRCFHCPPSPCGNCDAQDSTYGGDAA